MNDFEITREKIIIRTRPLKNGNQSIYLEMHHERGCVRLLLTQPPSKTEVIIRTEMSSQEAAVYEAVRQQAESAIHTSNGKIKSVFSYIVKARMAAFSASLLHPDIQVPANKLEKLVFLVKDLTAQGKKVLVFSQFVSFLELAKERLCDNGFSCLSIPVFCRQDSEKYYSRLQVRKHPGTSPLPEGGRCRT